MKYDTQIYSQLFALFIALGNIIQLQKRAVLTTFSPHNTHPPPPSLPVGTSVTRKINTKKKTRSKKKTCIKCKICANKLPQRATGYPRKPRGRGGAMLEKILPTVMKLPSINRQLYMLCITVRSMAFFSIWKLTTKTKTNKHKSYGRVYSTVTYPLVMWIKQFIMFNLYFVLHTLQRRPWKSVVPSNYFCSNFYVHFSIATIFSEAIWAFIVIVFTTNELSCIEITLEVRFFIDLRGDLKKNLIYVQYLGNFHIGSLRDQI